MSQSIFPNINPATTSGTDLATLLNAFKDAVASGFSGTSRPANLQAGGYWIDTSLEASPDFLWKWKIYDGTDDIEIFSINLSTNAVTLASADSVFEVLKTSADTSGALVKASKRRIANSGQVLDGDVIGEYQFVGRANNGSNPVVARIRSLATDNMTASANGAYLVFEITVDGQAVLSTGMVVRDGKLGVGTTDPDSGIHNVSTTGIKSERLADDALPARVKLRKRRIAGTGAVQNNDVIASFDANSTDDATAEATVGSIEYVATENHTASAQGTKASFKTTDTGTATKSEKLYLGDSSGTKGSWTLEAYTLDSQDIATTATINALSASKSVVYFTGSTATSLRGISSTGITKTILLHNKSSATITIEHDDAAATAADRILLPGAADTTLTPDHSIEFIYDSTASRWKVKSRSSSQGVTGNYISQNSSTKTPPTSAVQYQMTGNSVVIPEGEEWELTGTISFSRTSSPDYSFMGGFWTDANGDDSNTATPPGHPDIIAGFYQTYWTIPVVIGDSVLPMSTVRVLGGVGGSTVYLVPLAAMSTPSNARITTYINAKRLK